MTADKFWCKSECTISGTIFVYTVLVSQEIETYNHNLNQPLLIVPEWPNWRLNSKGLAFPTKNQSYFAQNAEFSISKLYTQFSVPILYFLTVAIFLFFL